MKTKLPCPPQVLKTVLMTACATAPGTTWALAGGPPQSVVIAVLAGFVGMGLSLPGVSPTRMLGGLIGAVIAHNAPPWYREQIMRMFTEDPEEADGLSDTAGIRCAQCHDSMKYVGPIRGDEAHCVYICAKCLVLSVVSSDTRVQ